MSINLVRRLTASSICPMIAALCRNQNPPSSIQYSSTPNFVAFVDHLFQMSEISDAEIIHALIYVARAAELSSDLGSEYEVATAALMIAMKYLRE